MIIRTNTNQMLKPALLAVLMGGLSLLSVGSLSGGQGAGDSGQTGEGGDNPVVGSLPVEVLPELDVMFQGDGRAPGINVPTLGLIGTGCVEDRLHDASGVPLGRVNGGQGFNILGLVHGGSLTFAREDGRRERMTLEQWLPADYVGGSMTMVSNVGVFTEDIVSHRFELPLKFLSNSTAPVVDAWIETDLSPDASSGPDYLAIHILMVGETVTVTYMP